MGAAVFATGVVIVGGLAIPVFKNPMRIV